MKIEMIDATKVKSKVPFVVGGVYIEEESGFIYQLVQYNCNDRFTWLQLADGFLCDSIGGSRSSLERELVGMAYVPNARLVIER